GVQTSALPIYPRLRHLQGAEAPVPHGAQPAHGRARRGTGARSPHLQAVQGAAHPGRRGHPRPDLSPPAPGHGAPSGTPGWGAGVLTGIPAQASTRLVSTPELRLVVTSVEDEGSLIARARAGDRGAQDLLVGRYLRDVYGAALRILGDPDLAQDAAQDAFVNALRGLERFRGDSSFRTWLLRIAFNSARSVARRRGRRREVALTVVEN